LTRTFYPTNNKTNPAGATSSFNKLWDIPVDVLVENQPNGWLINPQRLNSYSYGLRNPLSFIDPDGRSAWDVVQAGLDIVGLAPGLGEIADIANGLISLARGDEIGASLSFAAAMPFAGWGATAAKYGVKYGDEAAAFAASKGNEFVDVYRAFGGDARAQGFSWTTTDPRTVSNFRDAAGLPSGGASGVNNSADFLIQGRARASDIIESRSALPLDGNQGGLPELIIDPKNVDITDFSVLNP
jgi:hypothetical protein